MLALIGNLSFGEFVLIALVSVLVFGGRLPQVAARVLHTFRQLRRSLDDLKRETGIDRELRNIEYEIRDAERSARSSNPFAAQPPPGLRQPRGGDGAASAARATPGEAGAVEPDEGQGTGADAEQRTDGGLGPDEPTAEAGSDDAPEEAPPRT